VSTADLEADARFPSGPWTGFFLQPDTGSHRHMMELHLTFRHGALTGEGRDWVGKFVMSGRYDTQDGKCYWTKRYLGQHDVHYKGYNEGKGIWGTWDIPYAWSGGFHIWPEGMEDPTRGHLREEADVPISIQEAITSDKVVVEL
jgi:hypothetical protein